MILQPYAPVSGSGSEKGQVKIIKGDLFISDDVKSLEVNFDSNFSPEIVFIYYMGWDYAIKGYSSTANGKTVILSDTSLTYTPGGGPIQMAYVGGHYVAIGTVV